MSILPDNIVSAKSDLFSNERQKTENLEAIYDEEQLDCLLHLHSPLNEQHPDEFRRYLDLFYTFHPKRPYNVKVAYDRGFIQKNRKYKDGRGNYAAFCHSALIARHLDPDHWNFLHPDKKPTERFWVAMWAAKKSTFKVLDIDNKQNLLGYCQAWEGPLLPVVHCPLGKFIELKKIYDEFPGHLWCISSETLGLHVWEKYARPVPVQDIHRAIRPRLKRIGIACEIHPMFGRCFRRPFGQDYATITKDGLLTDWIEQLNYFEHYAATPSFAAIFQALRSKLLDQWDGYDHGGRPSPTRFRQPQQIDTAAQRRELEEIDAWAANGFPTDIIAAEATTREPASPSGKQANPNSCDIDLSTICDRDWVQTCELWARNGLPCEDSLFIVVSQLARWLYFVELFNLPENERLDKTKNILVHFCLNKHNGFISRLAGGLHQEVSEHVHRAVESGIDNADMQFKTYCAIMRQKREKGEYQKVIYLGPILIGQDDQSSLSLPVGFYKCSISQSGEPSKRQDGEEDQSSSSPRWVYKCGISQTGDEGKESQKPLHDYPLPPTILAKLMEIATAKQTDKNGRLIATMRKRKGEYPFIRFGRRFLNEIWKQGGEANIHFLHLNRMLDLKADDDDRKTALKFKNLLRQHGLIKGNWQKFIRRGQFSSRYKLTDLAYQEFKKCQGGRRLWPDEARNYITTTQMKNYGINRPWTTKMPRKPCRLKISIEIIERIGGRGVLAAARRGLLTVEIDSCLEQE